MWVVIESWKRLQLPDRWEVTTSEGKTAEYDDVDFLRYNPGFKKDHIITSCRHRCAEGFLLCGRADLKGRDIKGVFQNKYYPHDLEVHCRHQFLEVIPPTYHDNDYGIITSVEEKNFEWLLKTDKYPNTKGKTTSEEKIVGGYPQVGDRLLSCGANRYDCRFRETIVYRKWEKGGYWLSNGHEVDTMSLRDGDKRHYCTANDRNCYCDGKFYMIKQVKGNEY